MALTATVRRPTGGRFTRKSVRDGPGWQPSNNGVIFELVRERPATTTRTALGRATTSCADQHQRPTDTAISAHFSQTAAAARAISNAAVPEPATAMLLAFAASGGAPATPAA
jgi:hypothetical protein